MSPFFEETCCDAKHPMNRWRESGRIVNTYRLTGVERNPITNTGDCPAFSIDNLAGKA
jgi:hypothetical protein